MNTRTITITVKFDMRDIPEKSITPANKVAELVERDMIEHFGWDEGFYDALVRVEDE